MKLVLYGVETYCINNRVHQLIQEIDDMNVSRYQGLSREAVAATSRYPIMADKQAVIVETEKLTGDDTKMLESLDIPETTIFIVVVSGSVETRTNAFKSMMKKKEVVEYGKVAEPELKMLITKLVTAKNSHMEEPVIDYFIRYIGYEIDETVSLYTVNIAVKQLCYSAKEITEDDVRALITPSVQVQIWELSNFLLDLDGPALYSHVTKLFDEKENGIGMLSLLLRSFRLTYKASLLKGRSDYEISKILGVKPFQFKAAMKFTPQQISEILTVLQQGVNSIKAGQPEKNTVIFTLNEALLVLGGAA